MKVINSVANPYIKDLVKLYDKSTRDKLQKFIVEGYHLVQEALSVKALDEVLIVNEMDYIEGVNNILVTTEIIKKLSKTINPQNIIGICKIKVPSSLNGNKFLLLDNVADPGNLGTIIRTALGFKIDGIILSEGCVDAYNDKVIRSTQGAIFKLPIIRGNLCNYINSLKQKECLIIGTSLNQAVSLHSLKPVENYALILGNEANGISNDILQLTDINVKIEISPLLESLNVAVACAIVMYHLSI